MLSLAKYLPRHGYEVHVLSCRNPGMPVMDPSLCRHIPPEVRLHRSISPEPPYQLRKKIWSLFSRRPAKNAGSARKPSGTGGGGLRGWARNALLELLCPDPEVVWVPFATRRARRIIRRHGIGTVVVTAPPFSSFSIGVRLKREFPQLGFVADYRDDWLGYYVEEYDQYKNNYLRRRAIELEREMVEAADRVVCVTSTITELMRSRYPDQPAGKMACVYNGYDPESFADFRGRPHDGEKVVITYTGTLHKASSARYYLAAIDALPAELRARIETRFIGRITDEEAAFLKAARCETRSLGFLSQREAFRYLEESDYLLVTMMHAGSVTGKVFEYLATGKPILAFGPRDSEIARLIAATGAGWCVDPADDPAAGGALLERLIRERGNPEALGYRPDREAIRKFDRSCQAGEYSRIIDGIAGPER
jgi:glycosyltransferase involved in cell wall biosynthesis